MFDDIPQPIRDRMKTLEAIDARDRLDGTARQKRLRQIPPETGKFIALLAATAPPGAYIEVGTSAGYSALWLALACRLLDRQLTTFEVLADKVALAHETLVSAGVDSVVKIVHGNALDYLGDCSDISFCFIDTEKELYADCYEAFVPRMVSGGLLLADNAMNHEEALRPMLRRALNDPRVDAVIVPIGKGVLLCRKI